MLRVRSLLAALLLPAFAMMVISTQTMAQSDTLSWATPVNLSRSGAASRPVIAVVPDGTVRVLWWDEFDGLMAADGAVSALLVPGAVPEESREGAGWSAPAQAPILLPTRVVRGGREQLIPQPIGAMPHIAADVDGQAHAFWLGEPDEETGDRSLLYSRLSSGTAWTSPKALVGSAAALDAIADRSGTLHLAYVQPVQAGKSPVGLYYQQSRNGGANWSASVPVYLSRYLRLLPDEENDLRLTAENQDSVYVAWNDPHEKQVLVAHSADSGAGWSDPQPFTGSTGQSWENQMIAIPGRSAPLLWERAGEGQGMMAASSSGDALTLAAWDGARWSESKHLILRLQDPERGEPLRLSNLELALAPPPPGDEEAGQTLLVVGTDQNDDVWITGIPTEDLERLPVLQVDPLSPVEPNAGEELSPPAPVNLSRSGAASNPIIAAVQGDTLRAFWWDQFDGLTVADGTMLASSVLSGTEEIWTMRESWSEPRPLPLPATTTPRILTNAMGRVHAFWIQEPTRQEQVSAQMMSQPLMYSQLATDATTWLPPVILAESAVVFDVATDASGALHLAYVQTVDTSSYPAGVYYRRTEEDGARWSAPVPLDQSRYLRLLSAEAAHVRLAADEVGEVYVTWDDSRLEQLLLAYSLDGGETWERPKPLATPDGQPRLGQLLAIPGGQALLLWQDTSSAAACSLVQAPAAEVATGSRGVGEPVLRSLTACPENARFLSLGTGQVLMVVGSGSDSLTLFVWDGEQWSEPSRLGFSFPDPETGRQIYLSGLQGTLVGLPSDSTDGLSDQALVVVGMDQNGDVWATSSLMGALDVVFAPPPAWSDPVSFVESEGLPGLPTIASDTAGRTHVLWSEPSVRGEPGAALLYARRDDPSTSDGSEARWTSPSNVLRTAEGGIDEPALIAVGDRLHAVWRGGQDGEIFYSQAFASDAYVASGWAKPQRLPAPAELGSWPHIAAGVDGTLHVVYALPVNEGRGIYYTRSEDGETWSAERQVFDAAGAGWAMCDYPRLAMDLAGTIHVVWVRADPFGSGLTQEIYYARSVDDGETWSRPMEIAEGAYAWPQVTVSGMGEVHLLWNETTGDNAWWHQWSTDGGLGWTRPERVPGFGNVPGPVGLLADGSETVRLVGLGQDTDGKSALLYIAWEGQRWTERELFRLDLAMDTPVSGVSAALLPALGQLDVVFRGEGEAEGIEHANLWHTERAVPAVVTTPVPTFTPHPTPTPLPTPVPTPLATPTSSFSTAPLQPSGGFMADLLPLLLPGALAVLIVAGAFGIGFLRKRRR